MMGWWAVADGQMRECRWRVPIAVSERFASVGGAIAPRLVAHSVALREYRLHAPPHHMVFCAYGAQPRAVIGLSGSSGAVRDKRTCRGGSRQANWRQPRTFEVVVRATSSSRCSDRKAKPRLLVAETVSGRRRCRRRRAEHRDHCGSMDDRARAGAKKFGRTTQLF